MKVSDNFLEVLYSSYNSNNDMNESRDFVGILLTMHESNGDLSLMSEAMDFNDEESLLESEQVVTDIRIVDEGKGKSISLKVNGKEYRYVSPTKSTEELYRSMMGMMKYAKSGYKALNWIKKNALCYYGCKSISEEGKELVETTQSSAIPPNRADDELNESLGQMKYVISTKSTGMPYYDRFLNPKDKEYLMVTKGKLGKVEYMSPDQYISLCAQHIFRVSKSKIMNGVHEDKAKKYANEMSNGTKFDMPVIDYASRSQEGRHRALAARINLVDKIPVLVVSEWKPDLPSGITFDEGYLVWKDKDGSTNYDLTGSSLGNLNKVVTAILNKR